MLKISLTSSYQVTVIMYFQECWNDVEVILSSYSNYVIPALSFLLTWKLSVNQFHATVLSRHPKYIRKSGFLMYSRGEERDQ